MEIETETKRNDKPSTTTIGIIARMLSGVSLKNRYLQMDIAYLSAIGPDTKNIDYNYNATQLMLQHGSEN